jgi:hypothetical protein
LAVRALTSWAPGEGSITKKNAVHIDVGGDTERDMACITVITVSEKALAEPGHIRTLAAAQSPGQKHEFHALAQMALFQFEDRELTPVVVKGKIRVKARSETLELDDGLLVGRLATGQIVLLINSSQRARKFLVAALRFCSRWIRLDL